MTKGFSRFLFPLFVFVLTSCGGGGGGGNGAAPGGNGGGPSAPTGEPTGTIEGIAQDGPLLNATVTAYAWNGSKGAVLASAPTDFQGRYRLTIQATSQQVLLEVTGGAYVDEATFQQVSVTAGQVLVGVIGYQSGREQTATITYYTTLAAGLAERLVRNGSSASDAVVSANQRISTFLGLDVTTVPPVDITRSDLGITVTPPIAYGFATAALSSFTDFVATSNTSAHRVTSIQFIQLAYDDIRADGVLDGRGTQGNLFVGALPLTAEIYRHELALHVLRLADNPATNFSRVSVTGLVPVAKSLNDSTEPVFGMTPVVELASDAPNIAAVSLADKAVIFARTSISVTVASVAGISRVDAQLSDGQKVVLGPIAAPDAKNPIVVIDTTAVPDGPYQLTLTATDTAGAVATRTLSVSVNNQPVIDNVSLPTDRPVRDVQVVTATINDPAGVAKVQYFLNATLDKEFPSQGFADPRTPYRLDTRPLPDGQQTLRIVLTNRNAGTLQKIISFSTDNTPPGLAGITPATGAVIKQVRGPNGEQLFDEQNRRIGFVLNGSPIESNGLASIEVLVNGVSQGTRSSFPFPVPLPTDGVKSIVLRATDLVGNVTDDTGNSNVRQITFDATPPSAVVESPLGPSVTGQIRVLGSGRDNLGLSSLRLGIVETARNLEIGCFGGETGDSGAGGRYILTFDTSAFTNGTYQLTLYARDQAGNESTSQPVVLTFNNTPARTAPNQGNTTPKCFLAP